MKIEESLDDQIPPGRSKSGRTWKSSGLKASKRVDVKGLHDGYAKRMAKLKELRVARELENELKKERENMKQKIKEKRKEKERIKLENERKSEVVQVITNSKKLKKLSKKQMRNIVKR